MSIINQVLNELESRGVTPTMGEGTIRAVPPRKQIPVIRYAVMVGLIVVVLVAAMWFFGRQETRVPEQAALAASAAAPAVSLQASAAASAAVVADATASAVPVTPELADSLHGKPLLVVAKDEEPPAPAVKKEGRNRTEHLKADIAETADTPEAVNLEQFKKVTPQQRAENEYRKANLAAQEGRTGEALAGYETALLADPTFKDARKAWAGLLVSLKRNEDAENVLKKGIKRDPHDAAFAMMLARLQVERNDLPLALETLQKTLPYTEGMADYQQFVAYLLQRLNRHEEAIGYYRAALKIAPNNGLWWIGLGNSQQALERKDEAREAYQRALATNTLSPQLQVYVQQKLKEL